MRGSVYRRGSPSLLVASATNQAANIGRRQKRLSGRTTVPLFILVPQVTVRKRLDVAGVGEKWFGTLLQRPLRHRLRAA